MNERIRRRRRWLLVPFSLLGAILLGTLTAMPSLADTLVNDDVPVSGVVFNPCNGEIVYFQGIEHLVIHETFDNGGGVHLGIHDNIHVTAAGNQGNTYIGNQQDNFTLNGKVGFEETAVQTFSEISKGSAPNFVVHGIFHITVNANGTVTAFVDNFTAECRG